MLARSCLRVASGATAAVVGGRLLISTKNETRNDGAVGVLTSSSNKGSDPRLFADRQSSLVVPTVQAIGRVIRLGKTAVMMAIDYKAADFGLLSIDMDEEECSERLKWEEETEKRRKALEEAQLLYSSENSYCYLDKETRSKIKQKEKLAMSEAATALAEAEEKLAELGSQKSFVHRKAAERLKTLCFENKGVYIKVGQHLANLDYLIPQEYIEVLSALYDSNPRTDYADVREVLREDLGKDPLEVFDVFDPVPIASASLAQVHVAYEKGTGRKLAVKVQHRGLRETSAGDIYALVSVVRAAERMFEGFSWGWLADEIAPQLPKELDFKNEGRNAERAARDLEKTGLNCVIPKVLWKYTSPRVLTMDFEEGFKATDVEAIEKAGLKKRDVAKLISSVFSSQVFLSSFVHCDPVSKVL